MSIGWSSWMVSCDRPQQSCPDRVAVCEIFKDSYNRNACSTEDPRTADFAGHARDSRAL